MSHAFVACPLGGVPGGVAVKRDTQKKEAVAKKPIAAVKANAIYSPNPDARKLAGASLGDNRPGTAKVSFCVSTGGKVVDVKSKQKFRGGAAPKVDQIVRDTVKKWRFKPFVVGGKPQKTCSVAEFNIRFD